MDALQLPLDGLDLLLILLPLQEYLVQFMLELIVLVLDVEVGVLHVLRSGLESPFVLCEVVVSQLTLQVPGLLSELL